jgi:hypothetical protein
MELRLGDTGPDVVRLQNQLCSVDPDGAFGPTTQRAVMAYQAANGLEPDGVVGPLTSAALLRPIPAGDDDLDAVARLAGYAGRGKYVLGGGGTDPRAVTPFTWRGAQNGSDCIGAVMWALGCPRHHDAFPEYSGDINTDSALMDAGLFGGDGKGLKKFFKPCEAIHPGAIVIYRSVWMRDLHPEYGTGEGEDPSHMVRMGHVGLVVGWDGIGADPARPDAAWNGDMKSLITVECCAEWPAVVLGRNKHFIDGSTLHGVTNQNWRVRLLDFVGPRFA